MSKTVVLLILDGWGIGERGVTNPIYKAHPPTMEYIESHYPGGPLTAQGSAVGGAWREPPVSETSYVILGAGRTAEGDAPLQNTVGDVLAAHTISQMYIAETKRYTHLTHFLNGYKDEPRHNEFRILVPAPEIAHPDRRPGSMTQEIAARVMQALEESIGFICASIAAPDIVAHTGNFNAALETVLVVDAALGAIMKSARAKNATLIITASHGNLEQMRDPKTGAPETAHNINRVPFYVIDAAHETTRGSALTQSTLPLGTLADVAPTILELFGINPPQEMTGRSLLKILWNSSPAAF